MTIVSQTPEITFDDVLLLPGYSEFEVEDEAKSVRLETRVTKKLKLDIPIVSSPMPGITEAEMAIAIGKRGGLGFIHHFQPFTRQLEMVHEVKKHHVKVAVSVGDQTSKGMTQIENLLKLGADLISIETGHAHTKRTLAFIRQVKKRFPKAQLSAALVVTGEATKDAILAGADNVRVGIGGGSHCTTRLVTGVGRPQLSAVLECVKVAKKYNVPIMSDTGIKYAGDLAKAFAFGAETVMIGGLLSGTDQTPGPVIIENGKKYKMTWGMCTDTAMRQKQLSVMERLTQQATWVKQFVRTLGGSMNQSEEKKLFEEGVEKKIVYKGDVNDVITNLTQGLTRSMWYLGARDLKELAEKTKVVITSSSTHLENIPRI